MARLYRVLSRGLSVPLSWIFRVQVHGLEHLPKEGPFILAMGPHRSEFESVLVACNLLGHELRFIAKAEYWQKPVAAWLFDHTGMLPVSRNDSREAARQVQRSIDVLKASGVIAIYAEGTRGGDIGAPIHLDALNGTMPHRRLSDISKEFAQATHQGGESVMAASVHSLCNMRYAAMAKLVMLAIAELSGAPYSDDYLEIGVAGKGE